MLDALAHRGQQAVRVVSGPGFALGVRDDWLTPSSAGASQPLAHKDMWLTFDGRLDNRDDIGARINLSSASIDEMSDAELVIRVWRDRGVLGLEWLRGPFALLLFDALSRRVILARDIVGGRRLVYARRGPVLVVASEEQALLRCQHIETQTDQIQLAHHFTGLELPPGRTFLKSVSEVSPGSIVTIDGNRCAVETYYRPGANVTVRNGVEGLWVEEFNALLNDSVKARMRGVDRANVMMSGGLDSTTVAGVACDSGYDATAWSWRFDRFPECDERMYIRAMGKRHPLKQRWIDADRLTPLTHPEALIQDVNAPFVNPYRQIKQRLYQGVAASGGSKQVLLTGSFGDHLYADYGYWLRDLLKQGAVRPMWREIVRYQRELGVRFWWPSTVAKRLVGLGRFRLTPKSIPAWLSRTGAQLCLPPESLAAHAHQRPEHVSLLFGQRTAASHACEYVNACHAGIEIRHPFRDWRLMEFALSMPQCALYRPGQHKRILRLANATRLPPLVRRRTTPTSLFAFYAHGMRNAHPSILEDARRQALADFGLYLNEAWVRRAQPSEMSTTAEETALWVILSTAMWWQQLTSTNNANTAQAITLDPAA